MRVDFRQGLDKYIFKTACHYRDCMIGDLSERMCYTGSCMDEEE